MLIEQLLKPWALVGASLITVAFLLSILSLRLYEPIGSAFERVGYPGSYEAMEAAWAPAVPADENTARPVIEALSLLQQRNVEAKEWRALESKVIDAWHGWKHDAMDDLEAMRAILNENADVLELVANMGAPENARYRQLFQERDEASYGLLTYPFAELNVLLRWACLDALLREDWEEVFRILDTTFRQLHSHQFGWSYDQYFAWSDNLNVALYTLELVLRHGRLSDEALLRLYKILEKRKQDHVTYIKTITLAGGMSVEIDMVMGKHFYPPAKSVRAFAEIDFIGLILIHGLSPAGLLGYTHHTLHDVRALDASFHWFPRLYRPWIHEAFYATWDRGVPTYYDRYSANMYRASTNLIRQELLQCAIAIERYRLATGAYPEALEVLVPAYLEAVPRDMFDQNEARALEAFAAYEAAFGRAPVSLATLAEWATDFEAGAPPVKYQLDEDQYMVYSVGWDEVDRGGKRAGDPEDESEDDSVPKNRSITVAMPRR